MVRAIAYFMFMDLYGNVPIYTTYGDFEPKDKSPRAEVFKFIEDEVKASLPYLSNVVGQATYGRANKYTAFVFMDKMYLNGEYYTGTNRYTDCVAYCDSVISSEKYSVEPMSTYLQMFYPSNGPSTKEFIFAIPYDPAAGAALFSNLGIKYRYSRDTPGASADKDIILNKTSGNGLYNVKNRSGPRSNLPGFYNGYFKADPNDIRNEQWLIGYQIVAWWNR